MSTSVGRGGASARTTEYLVIVGLSRRAAVAADGERAPALRLRRDLREVRRRDYFPPPERDDAVNAVRALADSSGLWLGGLQWSGLRREVGDAGRGAHRPGLVGVADPPVHRPRRDLRVRHRPADVPADAMPFDMRGSNAHHGNDCTFETLLRRHDLLDPVLWRIAAIVHEADLEDDRYDAPEAAGLDVVLRGLSMTLDDDQVLDHGAAIFDGLYAYFHRPCSPEGTRHDPPRTTTPASRVPRPTPLGLATEQLVTPKRVGTDRAGTSSRSVRR